MCMLQENCCLWFFSFLFFPHNWNLFLSPCSISSFHVTNLIWIKNILSKVVPDYLDGLLLPTPDPAISEEVVSQVIRLAALLHIAETGDKSANHGQFIITYLCLCFNKMKWIVLFDYKAKGTLWLECQLDSTFFLLLG